MEMSLDRDDDAGAEQVVAAFREFDQLTKEAAEMRLKVSKLNESLIEKDKQITEMIRNYDYLEVENYHLRVQLQAQTNYFPLNSVGEDESRDIENNGQIITDAVESDDFEQRESVRDQYEHEDASDHPSNENNRNVISRGQFQNGRSSSLSHISKSDVEGNTALNVKYPCSWPSCSKIFRRAGDMRRHISRVHREEKYSCGWPFCTKSFTRPDDVRKHISRVHREDKFFKCEVEGCSKCYFSPKELKNHLVAHDKMKSLKCTWPGCSVTFSRSDKVRRHIRRVHYLERPYECTDCLKRFFSTTELKVHKSVHENWNLPEIANSTVVNVSPNSNGNAKEISASSSDIKFVVAI